MKPIKALANADEVIRLLSQEGDLSPAEIAELLGMPRPSVYRLLDGLSAIGLTEPLRESRAQLSLRWLHLADRAREAAREWRGVKPLLANLVESTGQTAYFSLRRGDEAVCLEWEQGRGIGVLALRPGRSLPLYAGAAGRVFLAFGGDMEEYLGRTERRALTTKTLVSSESLRADAAQARADGYTVSDEDVTVGIGALGVPVYLEGGEAVGALSIAGMNAEMVARRDEYLPLLRETAARLGADALAEKREIRLSS